MTAIQAYAIVYSINKCSNVYCQIFIIYFMHHSSWSEHKQWYIHYDVHHNHTHALMEITCYFRGCYCQIQWIIKWACVRLHYYQDSVLELTNNLKLSIRVDNLVMHNFSFSISTNFSINYKNHKYHYTSQLLILLYKLISKSTTMIK